MSSNDDCTPFEELEPDFVYLLELMPLLHNVPEYDIMVKILPIIGSKSLLDLCRHYGGTSIKLPSVQELEDSIHALQLFYDIKIRGIKSTRNIPKRYREQYNKICEAVKL